MNLLGYIRYMLKKDFLKGTADRDLYYSLKFYLKFFKGKNFLRDDVINNRITINGNIFMYLSNVNDVVNDRISNYKELVYVNREHKQNEVIAVSDFITTVDGYILKEHTDIIMILLEDTIGMLEYVQNIERDRTIMSHTDRLKSRRIRQYIIHIVNIYTELYTMYKCSKEL